MLILFQSPPIGTLLRNERTYSSFLLYSRQQLDQNKVIFFSETAQVPVINSDWDDHFGYDWGITVFKTDNHLSVYNAEEFRKLGVEGELKMQLVVRNANTTEKKLTVSCPSKLSYGPKYSNGISLGSTQLKTVWKFKLRCETAGCPRWDPMIHFFYCPFGTEMQSLPLWKLPFLARENFFRQMGLNDVFNLSMTSMKSKLVIMTFHKLPPARLQWYLGGHTVNYWNGTCAVRRVEDRVILNVRFARPWEGPISVYVEDLREGEYLKNPSLSNVNRTPILMYQDLEDDFLVCEKDKKRTFDEKMEVMKMISRHLLDIVNVESFGLSYFYHDDLPMKKFFKRFVFEITKKFRDVVIFNHSQKLKAREFKFLMNENETDEMELDTIGRVKGVFTHPKIELGRHSAVSFDNILNLQSQKFESKMHRLWKPSECVKLLLGWSNGEKLQNLKQLINKQIRELEGEVPFEIMENYFDDEDVLRLKRRSDGRVLKLQIFMGVSKTKRRRDCSGGMNGLIVFMLLIQVLK
ncbi:unnamed protein product [Caenorhabditis brenneri]